MLVTPFPKHGTLVQQSCKAAQGLLEPSSILQCHTRLPRPRQIGPRPPSIGVQASQNIKLAQLQRITAAADARELLGPPR